MDYLLICREMCDSHPRIVGAWVASRRRIIESAVKPGFGEPDKKTQKNMSLQAQTMISIAETHQDLYGKVKHVFVSFERFDSFLFPLEEDVIAIGCLKPYNFEEIIRVTEKILSNHAT